VNTSAGRIDVDVKYTVLACSIVISVCLASVTG
jgi:hypothetical protein